MTDYGEDGGLERPPSSSRFKPGAIVRYAGLALVDALALWSIPTLIANDAWMPLGLLAVGLLLLNWVYLREGGYPYRYLAPGVAFLVIFVVIPIIYTVYLSLTNFAISNNVSKDQAIGVLEDATITPDDPAEFDLSVYRNGGGDLRFLVIERVAEGEEALVCFGTPRSVTVEPGEPTCEPFDFTGEAPDAIGDFSKLLLIDLISIEDQVIDLALDTPEGEALVVTGTTAQAGAVKRYQYDAGRDVMIDLIGGQECSPSEGNFVCDNGESLTPGWRVYTAGENYIDAITDPRARDPLLRVFSWNVVFAVSVVFLQLALGLGLALTFHRANLRGAKIYRSVLILPYAIPAFISVLIWRGLFDADFGPINDMINLRVPWLLDGLAAKISVILVTVWQGFPYMMLITMGALQSIPDELLEAARVDGANAWQVFRRVTFPMLMVIIAPMLIASFAFNFNNFINIFLLTSGGPPILDYSVPLGETDLLITFTFTLATGGSGRFGLAAAYSILIFFLVAGIAAFSFRFTRRLEKLYGNL